MDDPYGALAEAIARALGPRPPHVVGIGGAVAVGKSTVAAALAQALQDKGRLVQAVSTDGFLLPNAVLDERGLTLRKGFPESFDVDALLTFLELVRTRAPAIEVPVYSHESYDILPGEVSALDDPDLVVLEGVVALQPPVADALDVAVYVDAEEEDVRRWFVERFVRMTEDARDDAASFYHGFAAMPSEALRELAQGTWDSINGVNLREHILPSRARADVVVRKSGDHSIREVKVVGR